MQSPQSIVTERMENPELGPETYGLATWVSSYRGHKWVQHGGGIDGFISQMAWLPNDSIGVVVLSNMSGDRQPDPRRRGEARLRRSARGYAVHRRRAKARSANHPLGGSAR